MNRVFTLLLLAALCAFAVSASAQVSFSNSVTYGTISGTPSSPATNTGAAVLIGNATIQPPLYSIQHGPLATTADITNYIQISLGGTNAWVTIATNSPSITNAGAIDSYTLSSQKLPVYTRVVPVATNSVSVGAQVVIGVNSVQ